MDPTARILPALFPFASGLRHPLKPRTMISRPGGSRGPGFPVVSPAGLGVEDSQRAGGPLWTLVHPGVPRPDLSTQS